jgi:hypothetical protein
MSLKKEKGARILQIEPNKVTENTRNLPTQLV